MTQINRSAHFGKCKYFFPLRPSVRYLRHEGFLRLLPLLLQHLHLGENAVPRGLKLPLLRLDLLHLVHQLIDLVIDACTGVKGF